MRNLEIVIKVKEIPDYAESAVEVSIAMETVQEQLDAGETDGMGITESGVKYSWELVQS